MDGLGVREAVVSWALDSEIFSCPARKVGLAVSNLAFTCSQVRAVCAHAGRPAQMAPQITASVGAIHRFLIKLSSSGQTCKVSPSRAASEYSTGERKIESSSREARPATITIANGFCESLPMPVDMAAGSSPKQATSAVIDRK